MGVEHFCQPIHEAPLGYSLSLNYVLTLLHMHIINPSFSILVPLARGSWMFPRKPRHFTLDIHDSLFYYRFFSNRKQTTVSSALFQGLLLMLLISLIDGIWAYLSVLWAGEMIWPFKLWMKYSWDLVTQHFTFETLYVRFSGKPQ